MNKRVMKIAGFVVLIGIVLGGTALGGIYWYIQKCAQENCKLAQQAHPHPGDDVAALIDFMNSDSHSLWDRTHRGVWTLGQFRDSRALPALEKVYTGKCDHEQKLCQYEVRKAVKLCGGTPRPLEERKH